MSHSTKRSRLPRTASLAVTCALAFSLVAAACGADDEDEADGTAAPAVTFPAFDGTIDEDDTEVCALGQATADQEAFPDDAQLERYQELAPPEIADAVDIAVDSIVPIDDELVAQLAVFGEDEVENAIFTINDWETAYCGIDHSGDNDPGPGATNSLDDSATEVDVAASEFTFEVDGEVKAGRTSFVLTNDGEQGHHLLLFKLADGVSLDEALSSEDEGVIEGQWGTNIAAPEGNDEEYLTLDLAPGSYGLVCFLPDVDETPHAFKGMAVPLAVS